MSGNIFEAFSKTFWPMFASRLRGKGGGGDNLEFIVITLGICTLCLGWGQAGVLIPCAFKRLFLFQKVALLSSSFLMGYAGCSGEGDHVWDSLPMLTKQEHKSMCLQWKDACSKMVKPPPDLQLHPYSYCRDKMFLKAWVSPWIWEDINKLLRMWRGKDTFRWLIQLLVCAFPLLLSTLWS